MGKSIGVGMVLRQTFSAYRVVTAVLAAAIGVPVAVWAQYPGQVSKKSKDAPTLRAVAVLEWTGEAGKPKACRIVPVTVYDGAQLQDAGIYLARPQPLALSGEVEYQLKENGKTIGLFDIENAGQEQGSWVGYGKWKAMPVPKPVNAAPQKVDVEDEGSDKPVLHRKKKANDSAGKTSGSGSGSTTSSSQPADDDPDRPKLHKKSSDDSSASTKPSEAPAADPDRPKLQKKTDDSKTAGKSSPDPDRPTLQKPRTQNSGSVPAGTLGDVESVANSGDPDRPRLQRGKSSGNGLAVVPTLMGLPPDMQQAVAVSDARNTPDHPWTYSWANPEDESKMKAEVEDIARQALGLTTPPPASVSAPKRTGTAAHTRTAKTKTEPPPPVPLEDEQFRVFELAYGSGATMVLSAHTTGPAASQKFVTIVAQPDLYGHVRVLLKSVTDMAHLDETPRMRLVDAVDALADNRGELLFELRGDGSRQFALYRIYRGTAEKLFVSSGGVYGTMSSE